MWLHDPFATSQSVPVPADSTLPLNSPANTSDWDGLSRSCTWNGKSAQPASLRRACKMGAFGLLTFGRISQRSMRESFTARLTSLSADCHANHSPSQDNSAEPTMSASSGRTSVESSMSVEPPWCSLKTSLHLFLVDTSELSEKNYREWAIRSKIRSSLLRKMLASRINARESSSWPTVDANTSTYSNGHNGFMNLREAAANWPTAKGSDGEKGGPNQRGSKGDWTLVSAAANWPSPDANVMNDGESPESFHARRGKLKLTANNGNGAGTPLAVASQQWMTPNVPNGGRYLSDEDVAAKGSTKAGKRQVGLESQSRMWTPPAGGEYEDAHQEQSPAERNRRSIIPPGPTGDWSAIDYESCPKTSSFGLFVHCARLAGLLPVELEGTPKAVGAYLRQACRAGEVKSAVRRILDGVAAEMDRRSPRFRAGGNGVVSIQGAIAFVEALRRAGIV